jgi:endogenous inhibitor of DNA gyrase (YacG/DUF329 family)
MTREPSAPKRLVRCPGCGGESRYATTNPHRPFCSARCRNNDFGAWASEAYRVEPAPAPEGRSLPPDEAGR